MDSRKPCRECGLPTANAARTCTHCLDYPPKVHRTTTEWKWLREPTDWKREHRLAVE